MSTDPRIAELRQRCRGYGNLPSYKFLYATVYYYYYYYCVGLARRHVDRCCGSVYRSTVCLIYKPVVKWRHCRQGRTDHLTGTRLHSFLGTSPHGPCIHPSSPKQFRHSHGQGPYSRTTAAILAPVGELVRYYSSSKCTTNAPDCIHIGQLKFQKKCSNIVNLEPVHLAMNCS